MAGGKLYRASDMNVIFQNEKLPCSSEVLESIWVPTSSSSFHGNFISALHFFTLLVLGPLS